MIDLFFASNLLPSAITPSVNGKLDYSVKWANQIMSERIMLTYDFDTNKIGVWKDGIFIREI